MSPRAFTLRYPAPVASAAWTPASLPNLVAWYDASNAASITSSGGRVSQWNDLSGNGYHLTQATGGNQPQTGVNTINGLNVLSTFDQATWMAHSGPSLSQPLTFLAVVQNTGGTIHDSNAQFLRGSATAVANSMLIAFSNTWQAQAGSFLNSGVTFSTDATAQQQVAIFNGASSSFWRNAGTAITGNAGSDGMDGIAVFAPDGSLNFGIQGNLGEVVITNSSIASGDRTSWNTYCARWGL